MSKTIVGQLVCPVCNEIESILIFEKEVEEGESKTVSPMPCEKCIENSIINGRTIAVAVEDWYGDKSLPSVIEHQEGKFLRVLGRYSSIDATLLNAIVNPNSPQGMENHGLAFVDLELSKVLEETVVTVNDRLTEKGVEDGYPLRITTGGNTLFISFGDPSGDGYFEKPLEADNIIIALKKGSLLEIAGREEYEELINNYYENKKKEEN